MFGSTRLASRLAVVGAAAVAAAVVAGVGVAGCSASPSSSASAADPASSGTPATSSPAASSVVSASVSTPASLQPASPSASPSATAFTPASAATAAAAPACPTTDLGPHVGLAQGTAGSIYQVIYFTNLSTAPCTLYGYPGVALADGSLPSSQVGAAATRSTATAATLVTLNPGQSANTLLRIVEAQNYPTATCKPTPTTFLQIFPPNQTTPIYLAYKSTGCASTAVNLLSVSVMTLGTGG